jgi:diacylglycerol kinase (ATP)
VAVLQTQTILDWLVLAARVLARRRRRDPQMKQFQARHVEIRCDQPQPVERDGDPADRTTELVVDVVPDALTLCVPAQEEQP